MKKLPLNWVSASQGLPHYDVLIAPFLQSNGRIEPEHRKHAGIHRPKIELYQRYQAQWAKDRKRSKNFPLWIFTDPDLSNQAKRLALIIRDFYHPKRDGNVVELNSKLVAKHFGPVSKPRANARKLAQRRITEAMEELVAQGRITWTFETVGKGTKGEHRMLVVTVEEGWHKCAPETQCMCAPETQCVCSSDPPKPFFQNLPQPPSESGTSVADAPAPTPSGETAGGDQASSERLRFVYSLVNRTAKEVGTQAVQSFDAFKRIIHSDNIPRIEALPPQVFEEFTSLLRTYRVSSARLLRDRMDDYLETAVGNVARRQESEELLKRDRVEAKSRVAEMLERTLRTVEGKIALDPAINLQKYLPDHLLDDYVMNPDPEQRNKVLVYELTEQIKQLRGA